MAIKQVFETEDGEVFDTLDLAVHHENVVALANSLVTCPHVTASWPYDGMMTAAKWLYDQELIDGGLSPVYRVVEDEEK
jgi:hypothetical protein